MSSLVEKISQLHEALADARVPHAFGGALALAWCTGRARGTIDIDLNLFIAVDGAPTALAALPSGIAWDDDDLAVIDADGQVRLWWDATPVDVFFNTTEFHDELAGRVRSRPFAGMDVPFLSCTDLAVFKAFFDRTKDWADLEAMLEADALDVERLLAVLRAHLGPTDQRVERITRLTR